MSPLFRFQNVPSDKAIAVRNVKTVVYVVLFVVVIGGAAAQNTALEPEDILPGGPIDFSRSVVLFYSESCPLCHEEIAFLDEIRDRYAPLEFVLLEIEAVDDATNREYFNVVMETLGSNTGAWPRTVVGNRVFVGFDESVGPLVWSEPFLAWAGYQNQIELAIADLHRRGAGAADDPGTDVFGFVVDIGSWRPAIVAAIVAGSILGVYLLLGWFVVLRNRETTKTSGFRLWIGGGLLVVLIGLFGVVSMVPSGAVAEASQRWPFPLTVTVIALVDGFNPCAFTVLFILLSLLTYTQKRGRMVAVGGIFIGTSAVVYIAFIMAMIFVGSFALMYIGRWVLRVIGVLVLCVGVFTLWEQQSGGAKRVTTLSADEKARLSRSAGRVVRRFVEADTLGARLTAIGAIILLAVVVNGVELGCTAILPAVYMGALLSTYGAALTAAHLGWTIWYGFVYVLPMVAILLDFIFTFRSRRVEERYGGTLKLVGGVFMIVSGAILALVPGVLSL